MGERLDAKRTGDPEAASLEVGERLVGTPYRIVRLLGTGAMGEVYEAHHEELNVRRALKVLGKRHGGHREMIERIRAEARSLSQLRHPNLVLVVDLGIAENGRWFFAMELLEGGTLRDRVASLGPLAARDASRILRSVLDGLGAAHASGIVHRDVKPENVFVCADGTVKVLDFGIAKFLEPGAVPLTQSGMTVGTPRYMAPEQVEGRAVDARTDVYAAGIVLYEVLSGNAPFEDDDVLALAYAHVTRAPLSLRERTHGRVPENLDAVVMKALEKNPKDRFDSAAQFRDALAAIEASLPSDAEVTASTSAKARAAVPTDPIRSLPKVAPPTLRRSSIWPWAIGGAVIAGSIVVAVEVSHRTADRRANANGSAALDSAQPRFTMPTASTAAIVPPAPLGASEHSISVDASPPATTTPQGLAAPLRDSEAATGAVSNERIRPPTRAANPKSHRPNSGL